VSRINLLPDSYVADARRRRATRSLIAGAVVVLIVCAMWGSFAYTQINALSRRMSAAQDRLAFEQDRARALEADRATGNQLRALLAHRAQLEAPIPAPGVLALLTQLLPESVAVTKLSMDLPPADLTDRGTPPGRNDAVAPPPPPGPPASTRVEMEGIALSDVELAKVVGTLASHKAFTNVKLVRSRQVTMNALTRFAFQITLEVPASAPPTAKPVAHLADKDSRGA
jgi:hypothetical protein